MKAKVNWSNVWYYFQGNFRYKLYKSKYFKWMLRKHIIQQFEKRLIKMNAECYINGECIKCGCTTPQLQFADKACKGNCYPKMASRKFWKYLNNYD